MADNLFLIKFVKLPLTWVYVCIFLNLIKYTNGEYPYTSPIWAVRNRVNDFQDRAPVKALSQSSNLVIVMNIRMMVTSNI